MSRKEEISIIFLDVDGVLNTQDSNGMIEDAKLILLKEIIDGSDAKIVISSSWRIKSKQLDKLSDSLKRHEMQWFDTTPIVLKYSTPERNRAAEIESYLSEIRKQYRVERWVSVDDYNLIKFKRTLFSGHFVNTSPFRGLKGNDVKQAIELLRAK